MFSLDRLYNVHVHMIKNVVHGVCLHVPFHHEQLSKCFAPFMFPVVCVL